MVGFQLLSEAGARMLSSDDVRLFFDLGWRGKYATGETRRVACSAFPGYYLVAPEYCEQLFGDIIASGNRDWITAALKALPRETWTRLPIAVLRLLLKLRTSLSRDQFVRALLDATDNSPTAAKRELLVELSNAAGTVLPTIKDDATVSAVLNLVKANAKDDSALALRVARALRCNSKANLGQLSVVLENISYGSKDPNVHQDILRELMSMASNYQRHIRNSLRRTFPRIELILGPRSVVEAVKQTVSSGRLWDERALGDLVRAAVRIPSWTHADSEALIAMSLPPSVSAILLSSH
jgi:hypothetical protein